MYRWYDKLKEPTRFLVFFIPACLLIVGIYVPWAPINFLSGGLLMTALVTRIIYIHTHRRKAK